MDVLSGAFARLCARLRLRAGGVGLLHHAVRSGSLQLVEWVLGASRAAGAPLDAMEPAGVCGMCACVCVCVCVKQRIKRNKIPPYTRARMCMCVCACVWMDFYLVPR